MMDWNVSDETMREHVLGRLTSSRDEMIRQAERCERYAADRNNAPMARKSDAACAVYSRRAAAHFQQAIDALSALPMPAKEDA